MLTTNEYISNQAPWWSQLKEFKENIRVQHIMRQFTYIIFIIYVYVREKVCHPLESHNSDASIYFIKKEYPPICNYFSPRFTFKHIITSFVFTVLQECLVHFSADVIQQILFFDSLYNLQYSVTLRNTMTQSRAVNRKKRSFIEDWKFNICPGYPPKIVTLEQQEACAILS